MKISFLFITFFFVATLNNMVTGQTKTDSIHFRTPPVPVIGWDSLKQIIERPENYPEVLRRAGIEATIEINIDINSNGKILNVLPVHISGYDTLLIPPVANIIKSIQWKPGVYDGQKIIDSIRLVCTFYMYHNDYPPGKNQHYFLIEAPIPLMEKVR